MYMWTRIWFSSVAQSCTTLCEPMDCSTPGFPIHHQLPESTQTHFHRLGDVIQPSYPLSSPSPQEYGISCLKAIYVGGFLKNTPLIWYYYAFFF